APAARISENQPIFHSHPRSHGSYVPSHPHRHAPEVHPHSPEENPLARLDRGLGNRALYQALRPLIVGIIHGLAGSAAVALLIFVTAGNAPWRAMLTAMICDLENSCCMGRANLKRRFPIILVLPALLACSRVQESSYPNPKYAPPSIGGPDQVLRFVVACWQPPLSC